jgi:hypothetical protein
VLDQNSAENPSMDMSTWSLTRTSHVQQQQPSPDVKGTQEAGSVHLPVGLGCYIQIQIQITERRARHLAGNIYAGARTPGFLHGAIRTPLHPCMEGL